MEARSEAELDEARQEMDAILFAITHDLRAPLRAMQGFAVALMEDCGDRLDATGQDHVERIVAAAQRMDALLQDLLAYSRLGRAHMPLSSVPLGEVVTAGLAAHAAEIDECRAEVTVAAPLPSVEGHRPTLFQVIGELLTNALRFVSPDRPPRVRIRADGTDECVRLWIEDNGLGVPPEHQTRIFRVFERLHGVEAAHYRSAPRPGTGIGLAIVCRGVQRMGGRVGVESIPGEGSRFWLELPRGS